MILEFNEKLQELRKKKGLTQEELASFLYVSRTAISKWESGRGVPNIESLKAISQFFGITIDELLSGEEILTIADKDVKRREHHIRDLVFGLLDCSVIIYLFLPFFGERTDGVVASVSILGLYQTSLYVKITYMAVVFVILFMGILTLALQNCEKLFWVNHKHKISVVLSVIANVIFMITLQPYAALFAFVFVVIKAFMLIKH